LINPSGFLKHFSQLAVYGVAMFLDDIDTMGTGKGKDSEDWDMGKGVTGGISDTGFGWVGLLGALFFLLDIEKNYIFGCIYTLLAHFGHKNWTNQCLVPCGRVLILKVPY
jgi:hypothetical protein